VLTRENCFVTKKGNYIKDLRIIKNRELKDIVIIDNSVEAFGLQINNGIPILSYNGEEEDSELSKLVPFLRTLSAVDDVRPFIRDKFSLTKLL
jgi:CTD small phosphatase-like protein 2